jgi:hypothetical protein
MLGRLGRGPCRFKNGNAHGPYTVESHGRTVRPELKTTTAVTMGKRQGGKRSTAVKSFQTAEGVNACAEVQAEARPVPPRPVPLGQKLLVVALLAAVLASTFAFVILVRVA